MDSNEIEKQIEHVSGMRTYTDEQQIAKANALGVWQIALQLAKMMVDDTALLENPPTEFGGR